MLAGHQNRKKTIQTGVLLKAGNSSSEGVASGHKRGGAGGQAETLAGFGAARASPTGYRQKETGRLDAGTTQAVALGLQDNGNLGNR